MNRGRQGSEEEGYCRRATSNPDLDLPPFIEFLLPNQTPAAGPFRIGSVSLRWGYLGGVELMANVVRPGTCCFDSCNICLSARLSKHAIPDVSPADQSSPRK